MAKGNNGGESKLAGQESQRIEAAEEAERAQAKEAAKNLRDALKKFVKKGDEDADGKPTLKADADLIALIEPKEAEALHDALSVLTPSMIAGVRASLEAQMREMQAKLSKLGGGSLFSGNGGPLFDGRSSGGKGKGNGGTPKAKNPNGKPTNYEDLKKVFTKPMTKKELEKALDVPEAKINAMVGNYPHLFQSDGGRPATYTFKPLATEA